MRRRWPVLPALVLVVAAGVAGPVPVATATPRSPADGPSSSGRLSVVWADPAPGEVAPADPQWTLQTDRGPVAVQLPGDLVARAGGVRALAGALVDLGTGTGTGSGRTSSAVRQISVRQISVRERSAGAGTAVRGAQPYVTLPCAFPDAPARPRDRAFFTGMYGRQVGRLGDYWRAQSYGAMTLDGSTADDWAVMPEPRRAYVTDTGTDLDALFRDCTAAHDAAVDFSRGGAQPYRGINLFFNTSLGCCAWGGMTGATLDGLEDHLWSVTWQAPWAWQDVSVLEHEMGHSLGLPHSNNSDRDGDPYDSPWDVMSGAQAANVRDATYGLRGQHTVAHHKELLGWVPAAQRYLPAKGTTRTVTLDPSGAATTRAYRTVRLPVPGSTTRWYSVEVRERSGPYDGALPVLEDGERAVLISSVDTTRSEPSWIVDKDRPPSDTTDTEGVVWRSGEVWRDVAADLTVRVGPRTATGLRVTVTRD